MNGNYPIGTTRRVALKGRAGANLLMSCISLEYRLDFHLSE